MDVGKAQRAEQTSVRWSCEPSEGRLPIYAGTELYVSKVVLDDLRVRFGPTGTKAWESHKRYGWELILVLLGPERLQFMEEYNIGVAKMVGKMVQTADVFLLILQHARQVYNLPALANDLHEQEKYKFGNFCSAMLSKLRTRRPTSANVEPARSIEKSSNAPARTPASTSRPSFARSPRKRPKKTRKSDDYPTDTSSDEEETVQTEYFLRHSTTSNSTASAKNLKKMMNSLKLKKEVTELMQIAQSLAKERRNYKEFVEIDGDFVITHQEGRDLHFSIDQVKEFYSEGWSVKHKVPGWSCKHCSWICTEEERMRWHVVKRHFFRAMGVEEGSSVNIEVDTTERHPVTANQEARGKPSMEREASVIEVRDSSDDEEVNS